MRALGITLIMLGLYMLFRDVVFGAELPTAQSQSSSAGVIKKSAIAEFGEPLYAGDIAHLPYANPDAPKGGRVVLSDFGSFDTLNFYVQKGEWPSSIGAIYDNLMTGSGDEIDGLYGLIAEYVEYPEDKSWAIFTLRDEAVYHDGEPDRRRRFRAYIGHHKTTRSPVHPIILRRRFKRRSTRR